MRKWSRYLVGVVAVAGLLVLVTHVDAETCTLEMKTVEASTRTSSQSVDYLANATYPQSFFQQLGGPQGRIVGASDGSKPKFSDVIKKEPEYATDKPFRGVAALGSQHYGFVFDIAAPEKKEKDEEEKKEDTKDEEAAEEKKESGGSLLSMLGKALVPSLSRAKGKVVNYTRIHFDRNHNGDLTDDEVIEATSSNSYSSSMAQSVFPTVDLTIDVDGKQVDYAFRFNVFSNVSSSYAYANASLNSAAYREGEITLDGKKRRIVLIDFNSNGRFDDVSEINEQVRMSNGAVYPTMGDMLYVDPQLSLAGRNPYDATTGEDQYQVGKLIGLDGRFFQLKIDPSGETLSLEPSSEPVGYVTNPNKGFRAIVYGDQGMLKITPDDSGKVPLPEGDWKLLSYTIQQEETPEVEPEAKKDEENSILGVLSSALTKVAPTRTTRPRLTLVSARATADYEAVKVVGDETAEMRFGPPYTPKVDPPTIQRGQSSISLSMSLVGIGGEVCSGLTVNGGQPSAPEFTISTKDGEEVAAGKFKYG